MFYLSLKISIVKYFLQNWNPRLRKSPWISHWDWDLIQRFLKTSICLNFENISLDLKFYFKILVLILAQTQLQLRSIMKLIYFYQKSIRFKIFLKLKLSFIFLNSAAIFLALFLLNSIFTVEISVLVYSGSLS